MTKRIVSGIFILTALGALGVILAGALTSGEQLIVRFLTAVIVAALGLYVISDLRLQADDDAAGIRPGTHPRLAGIDAPPNSTAAFMATVTQKGESPSLADQVDANKDDLAGDEEIEPHETVVGTTSSSTSEHDESAVVEDAGSPGAPPVPSMLGPAPVTVRASELPVLGGRKPATITDLFAKRARESNADRTWPTFGTISGPDSSPTSDDGANGANVVPSGGFLARAMNPEARPEEGDSETAEPAGQHPAGEDPTTADDAGHDEGAEPVDVTDQVGLEATETAGLPADAVTEFEYSGALEAPVFEWPAAPSNDDEASEASVEAEQPAASIGVASQPLDEQDGPVDIMAGITADTEFEAEHEPIDATDPSPPVNGVDRPLPAPFLASASASAVDYADAPLAPIIDLRNAAGSSGADIDEAIKTGEVEVVAALIEQGMLSTGGPISDRDVRTMVYVAFTSNELRKLLVAGGTPDSPNPEIDLGPVELFQDGMIQPPKTLYPGPPVEPEARSQLG